ncbi:MAG: hypothetical protein MUF42_04730 [Cytophagaceae bacterium]|jgi:hypothetical protein|nr:hypothetical protein [Cytophagaceae bacterium]
MKRMLSVICLLASIGMAWAGNDPVIKLSKLKLKEVVFSVNGEKVNGDEIPYGTKLKAHLEGITGFSQEGEDAFVDADIRVLDAKGGILVTLDSLFYGEAKGRYTASVLTEMITLSLQCQSPLKLNSSYTIQFIVRDLKGGGRVQVDKKIKLVLMEGLSYVEKGLTTDGPFIYVKEASSALSANTIPLNSQFSIYFAGLKGATVVSDSLLLLEGSIRWFDKKGKLLQEFPDLFAGTEITEAKAKELISFYFEPPQDVEAGTRYKLEYFLRDKKSDKYLSATFEFVVK